MGWANEKFTEKGDPRQWHAGGRTYLSAKGKETVVGGRKSGLAPAGDGGQRSLGGKIRSFPLLREGGEKKGSGPISQGRGRCVRFRKNWKRKAAPCSEGDWGATARKPSAECKAHADRGVVIGWASQVEECLHKKGGRGTGRGCYLGDSI